MKIDSISIINFRNYEKALLTFSDTLNIIYGKNGSGKTNIVEAIYALALTKSFRTGDDKRLITKGKVSTKISGHVMTDDYNDYEVIINTEGKKVKINNNPCQKISDYVSNINVVLFQPDDQMLLKLSPSVRRKMLNIEISQLNKNYLIYLNNYNKILKQRNFYLRELFINSNASKDFLDILTEKLINYGIKIHDEREKYINSINKYISEIYYNIFDSGELKIKYNSDYNKKNIEEIMAMYKKNYNREINFGKTLYGVQHDDIDFILNKNSIKEWGSIGEQKNAILSFKMAELKIIEEEKGMKPILILDDIFSELDKSKVKNIIKILDSDIQTFITTTEIERISKKLVNKAKRFKVKNGQIMEVIK